MFSENLFGIIGRLNNGLVVVSTLLKGRSAGLKL